MLRSARLCVHCKQSAPCYNHSLPACNAAYPAHVALWRAVLALQRSGSMLRLDALSLRFMLARVCCAVKACACITNNLCLHPILRAHQQKRTSFPEICVLFYARATSKEQIFQRFVSYFTRAPTQKNKFSRELLSLSAVALSFSVRCCALCALSFCIAQTLCRVV